MPSRPETSRTRRKLAVVLALASLANFGKSTSNLSLAAAEVRTPGADIGLPIWLSRLALMSYAQTDPTSSDAPINQVSIGTISASFESSLSQVTVSAASDVTNTNTPNWRCIKDAEGSDYNGNYTQTSGAFGILTKSWVWTLQQSGIASPTQYPVPGDAPPTIQDEAALFIFGQDNDHFYPSWKDYCTEDGLVK